MSMGDVLDLGPVFQNFADMTTCCCCRLPSGGTPEDSPRSLWIYTTPMGANSTRLIINFARRTDQAPAFKPKWQDAIKRKLFGFALNSRHVLQHEHYIELAFDAP